jgi:hypothetical protein
VAWRRLLPGAAFAAVGWSALQTLGVYILDRQLEQANLIYGVFAVVIVLLLWPRSLLQPPLTEPDRRVLAALAQTEQCRPEETVAVRFSSEADGPSRGRS